MKLNLRFALAAAIAVSVSLISCKKDKDKDNDNTDIATQSDDQSRVSSANDDVANDANSIANSLTAFNGRNYSQSSFIDLPCDATYVLDSTATDARLRITYNGTVCLGHNRTRTGTVTITMPLGTRWIDQNAVLTIQTSDLHITRISDGKSITIAGTQTITNVTGGCIGTLTTGSSAIVHNIASSGITVTFDNGSQRNWQVSKRRTFSYDAGIVITTEGTHSEAAVDNIAEWGTNRFGDAFTSSISQAMVIRQDCSWRLTSGEITHRGALGNVVASFGLDAAGNVTGCPGITGVYYFKAVWTGNNGIVRTVIYPY